MIRHGTETFCFHYFLSRSFGFNEMAYLGRDFKDFKDSSPPSKAREMTTLAAFAPV